MPKATKYLGLVSLLLVICSAVSITFGPEYALYRDPELACCSELEVGGGWIRLGGILFLVAIALVVAGIRLWRQDRSMTKHNQPMYSGSDPTNR